MNKEEIMKILPHRDNMLLIDDAECVDGTAIAHYTVRGDEFFLKGHFPGNPVMPGVLIIEALAQVGAVCALTVPENQGKLALFGGIKEARFRQQVVPGDVLELSCEIIKQRGPVGVGKAVATVNGKVAANAELTFMLVDNP